MPDAITITGLRKEYRKDGKTINAVDGIDLQIPEGIVFGLLGPNGAGKSTTINLICTLLRPTAGTISILGTDLEKDLEGARRKLGLVFQETTLDLELTGYQNLKIHAMLYSLPNAEEEVKNVLDLVGMTEHKDKSAKTYSGGMKRRLEVARAVLTKPKILLLDEPTLGLDAQARRELWDYVGKLIKRNNTTVLLTTHYLEEAERMCSRIAVIESGKILAQGTPQELIDRVGDESITITLTDGKAPLAKLKKLAGVRKATLDGNTLTIQTPKAAKTIAKVVTAIGDKHIAGITMRKPTLEDAYLKMTGKRFDESDSKGRKK